MKVRHLSVSLCLMAVGFAFCAAPVFAQEKVELQLWTSKAAQMEDAHEYIIAEFEKLYPNVRVAQRFIDVQRRLEIVRMAFLAGNEPDIVELPHLPLKERLAKEGRIVDLTDWYGKYGDRFPQATDTWTMVEDRYYAIPMDFHVLAHLYYNQDILNKYGIAVPKWWNEFMQACEKLKAQDELPIAFGNQRGNTGEHWIQRLLTETIGASGITQLIDRTSPAAGPFDPHWTDCKVVQAVQIFEDLHTKGYFPEGSAIITYNSAKMMFLSGQGAFYEDGSWFVGGTEIPPDLNWGFFRFPHMRGEIGATRNGGVASYLDVFSISTSSPQREQLCLDFLEFYTRPKIQGHAYYELGRVLPSVKGALEGIELPEFEKAVLKFAETCDDNAVWLSDGLPMEVGQQYIRQANISISAGEIDAAGFCEQVEKAQEEYLREIQE